MTMCKKTNATNTLPDAKAVSIIERWLNCSHKDAQMIFNGVYAMGGDYYSAFILKSGELEICKNGETIHRISSF